VSIISKKSFILDEDDDKDISTYTLPSLVTSNPEVISIKKSATWSAFLHVFVPALIWFISIVLLLLGINLSLFNKVKPQPKKDIEFVLVDKPGKPRDPNTKNRSDMDSRSGGINDPNRKVSMPSPAPQKQQKPSAAANNANKIIKKQQQQVVQKPTKSVQPKPAQQPNVVEKPSPAKPPAEGAPFPLLSAPSIASSLL
jgi:hypothetical protein